MPRTGTARLPTVLHCSSRRDTPECRTPRRQLSPCVTTRLRAGREPIPKSFRLSLRPLPNAARRPPPTTTPHRNHPQTRGADRGSQGQPLARRGRGLNHQPHRSREEARRSRPGRPQPPTTDASRGAGDETKMTGRWIARLSSYLMTDSTNRRHSDGEVSTATLSAHWSTAPTGGSAATSGSVTRSSSAVANRAASMTG